MIDALSASSSLRPTTAGNDAFGALTAEDFTRIIFTELGKQDPLAPNDTNALIQQIANIRSIQSDVELSDRLQALVGSNEFASAAGLVGRRVSGVSEANERVEGLVRSVQKTREGVVLTLESGARVGLGRMDSVSGS